MGSTKNASVVLGVGIRSHLLWRGGIARGLRPRPTAHDSGWGSQVGRFLRERQLQDGALHEPNAAGDILPGGMDLPDRVGDDRGDRHERRHEQHRWLRRAQRRVVNQHRVERRAATDRCGCRKERERQPRRTRDSAWRLWRRVDRERVGHPFLQQRAIALAPSRLRVRPEPTADLGRANTPLHAGDARRIHAQHRLAAWRRPLEVRGAHEEGRASEPACSHHRVRSEATNLTPPVAAAASRPRSSASCPQSRRPPADVAAHLLARASRSASPWRGGEVPSGRAAAQRIAAIFGVESVVANGLVIVVLLKLLHT